MTIKVGERVAGVVGGVGVVAVDGVLGTREHVDTAVVHRCRARAVRASGWASVSPAMTSLTANSVASTDLGVAGAMQQLMTQLGAVVGSVVLSTVSAAGGAGNVAPYRHAFVVAMFVAAAGCLAASFTRSTPRAAPT